MLVGVRKLRTQHEHFSRQVSVGLMTGDDFRLVEVDAQRDPRWERFLSTHPEALPYHHPGWLKTLSEVYHHHFIGLSCEDADGRIQGVLPLFRRGTRRNGDLRSLPHTPVAGPLATSAAAMTTLLRGAVQQVEMGRGRSLQLRSARDDLAKLVDDLIAVPWIVTYRRDLPAPADDLRFGDARNHGAVKRAVKKAEKAGVRVRPAESLRELKDWYQLYLVTMRSHAVPPIPFRFFSTLWDTLRPLGMMRLLVADRSEREGRMLAGSVYFLYGRSVFFAFNGRREADLAVRPNDAIQWRAIHDAWQEGFRSFDMGEVDPDNPGLAAFKLKWGMEKETLYRYYYPAAKRIHPLKSSGLAHRIARRPWRRLPLGMTVRLGELLYR
jgi:hypothetical protein